MSFQVQTPHGVIFQCQSTSKWAPGRRMQATDQKIWKRSLHKSKVKTAHLRFHDQFLQCKMVEVKDTSYVIEYLDAWHRRLVRREVLHSELLWM